jgi:hypothetical protein
MSRIKNPKFHQVALEAGGSHYPDVGGELLEQALAMAVKQCAEIAQTAEPYQASDLILKHFEIK